MGLPMDEVDVEIAPGADPSADPSTWTWVNICAAEEDYPNGRVQRPVTITTGRTSEGASARPSTCTLVVRNEDGAFTPANPLGPWYGELGKGTPLRVTWSGSERFSGFISELPTRWLGVVDNSRVTIRADGITRRVEQGAPALDSALFRSLSTDSRVVAYWPCEDNEGSESAASPIMGVRPWSMPAEFASIDGPPGSDRLLRVTTDTASTMARVPKHTPDDVYVVQVAYQIEDESSTRILLTVHTTSGDLARWQVAITDTTFRVRAWDGDGTLAIDDTDTLDHSLFGQWVRVELRFLDTGTGVGYTGTIFAPDVVQTELNSVSGSEPGAALGRVTRVGVGAGGDWAQDRHFGHLSVMTGTTAELPDTPGNLGLGGLPLDRGKAFHGYQGELAADRFERLCDEEGLTCSITAPTGGLRVDGTNASTPNVASLGITGDIDVRCWVASTVWDLNSAASCFGKWSETDDERSWRLAIRALPSTGIQFQWTTDGTSATISTVSVALPTPPRDGEFTAFRATVDVDDGASGHVVTLYFGPSLDGPWIEIGSETLAGTTSIHSGTADLTVGADDDGDPDIDAVIWDARLYDGIGGTLVADPDFTAQTIGATSFNDDAGNTWTVNGNAAIVRADDTMPMGPQQIDTLLANLRDIEVADGGILTDLTYRTRSTLHNQTATEIEFCDLHGAPELTDDDRSVVNDVTVSRIGGSSVRLTDEAHIGRHDRYDDSVSVNISLDDLLVHVASWRLNIGTTEAARWPVVPLSINTETQHLLATWLGLRIGDRIQIPHTVPQLPGVDIDLLIQGWTEVIYSRRAEMFLNCVPASPFTVWQLEHDTYGRIDTSGAETSGSFDAGTDTSLTVVTTAERPWINSTDHAAQFPFEIAVSGVVLNVTAISGSSSPQTFTVTQAPVNGVEKTIPTGSAVHIHPIPVLAL